MVDFLPPGLHFQQEDPPVELVEALLLAAECLTGSQELLLPLFLVETGSLGHCSQQAVWAQKLHFLEKVGKNSHQVQLLNSGLIT